MANPDDTIQLSILVIDDESAIRRTIGDHLVARGHRVQEAEDGQQGLDVLARGDVDVVITDLKMPGKDGFEVLREARRIAPDTEVIMVTAFGEVEAAVQAMREGAFDFFTKPVRMRDLTAALHRTLRFQALRRENERYRERLDHLDAEARSRFGLGAIIGDSPAITEVKDRIRQVC